MHPDGGRVAARGYQYQYLRTLEALLSLVENPQIQSVRVEGPSSRNSAQADAVDFDVVDTDDHSCLAVQVKSKAPGGGIGAAEAFSILAHLVTDYEAASYQLLTNGMPTVDANNLAEMLEESVAPQSLRVGLETILASAPARLAQLRALSSESLARLARSRIQFDERDDTELRMSLRESLRVYRNRARKGLGERSAGLLTGYLVSEILRRAADANCAEFTVQDLRSLLLAQAEDLARVTGVRDWGVIVGAMPRVPDVSRPALLRALVDALDAASVNQVRQVTMVGLSGIGKSSLAAAYICDRADSYDYIFWVDGETDESILASFRRITAFLHPASNLHIYQAPAEHILQGIHAELSRLPGRWAIVFDNVSDLRHADSWVPRIGRGDVIITSIDSSVRYDAGSVIDVGPMTESEALQLLRTRLNINDRDSLRYADDLTRLARGLSCWPLAMELAGSYMDACGISLNAIDSYLDQLKIHSLADQDSLPRGYPRTIAAAMAMCLEQLHQRATNVPARQMHARLAISVLFSSAFVASRRAPVHMLAAAGLLSPPDKRIGVWHVHPSVANLGEVVRELRRFSLVSFDEDIPPVASSPIMDADCTIAINSVVQDFMRTAVGLNDPTAVSLNVLANHVQRWLTQALDLNLLERASVLFTHADVLADHLRRFGIFGKNIALLYGNLASAYWVKGDTGKAEDLLCAELAITERGEFKDDLLSSQAKLALATMFFSSPITSSIDSSKAIAFLRDVIQHATAVRAEFPNAAVKLCLDVRAALKFPAAQSAKNSDLDSIAQTIDKLISELGPTAYSDIILSLEVADSLISNDQPLDAEHICRRALKSDILTGGWELEARRVLVESLVRQRKWGPAQAAYGDYRLCFGTARLHVSLVTRFAHNVGYYCAFWALMEGDEGARDFLSELLAWPLLSEVMINPADGSPARICLLGAICRLLQGEHKQTRLILQTLRPSNLAEGSSDETRSWCMLWQLTCLAAFRAFYAEYGNGSDGP